jgi:D-beta-D-heptose 7-phosphate kinase/D-beta-D-heptose 1-phosphate adenosyltransferase
MSTSVVLVTGGFDPIHSGHISLLNSAKQIAPMSALAVGLNSDHWLKEKKGKPFMPLDERIAIVRALKVVDNVLEFNDTDGSANEAIEQCLQIYDKVIFANGGDRHNENVPEFDMYENDPRVVFRWGVGGVGKKQSSSWLLKSWDER